MKTNKLHLTDLRKLLSAESINPMLISEYEKFLFLIQTYPQLNAVPTKEIDVVWHLHLKQKDLYEKDCQRIFGHLLIHREANNQKEVNQFKKAYIITKQLWFGLYGYSLGVNQNMAACGVDGDSAESGYDYIH